MHIEGADGARVTLASAMPIQGIQQRSLSVDADEYAESGAFSRARISAIPAKQRHSVSVKWRSEEGESRRLRQVSHHHYHKRTSLSLRSEIMCLPIQWFAFEPLWENELRGRRPIALGRGRSFGEGCVQQTGAGIAPELPARALYQNV